MSVTYQTPGVYIQETANQSVSIPNVATSIPAFLGVTADGGSEKPVPVRISSLLEFVERFGQPASPTWDIKSTNGSLSITGNPQNQAPTGAALMYYALQWYFLNGGGACYIVACKEDVVGQYTAGLAALATFDEPTLIVPVGAIALEASQFYVVCNSALAQAAELRDRFCVFDVPMSTGNRTATEQISFDADAFRGGVNSPSLSYGAAYYPYIQTAMAWEYKEDAVTFEGTKLELVTNTTLKAKIVGWLRSLRVVLPPSAAVVGVYATVDKSRGVWKAPANIGLIGGVKPLIAIDDVEQRDLNVSGGKSSINAIRNFANQGLLVWGARTLDYRAADWTFVPVRRLFVMMEESIAKALNAFVFEPNDRTTWTHAKASIDSYLHQLWQQGALAGSKPEEAYQVRVGLGETMNGDDVREGRMIIDVRVAPVRPAEFIVIQFSQDLKGA